MQTATADTIRLLRLAKLVRARMRISYADIGGGHARQCNYVDACDAGEKGDAWLVLSADDTIPVVLGCVYRWDDGEWTVCRARDVHAPLPEARDHLSAEQVAAWERAAQHDQDVVERGWEKDLLRKADGGRETRRTLLESVHCAKAPRTRAAALARLGVAAV